MIGLAMAYYINLFTAETWREIRENARFEFTGHREGARNREQVVPGDILLCWVTKTSACVGALKVTSEVYEVEHEDPPTWVSHLYPVRFKVELLVRVPVTSGVRLDEIRTHSVDSGLWSWVYRNSLNEIPQEDGDWILTRLNGTDPKLGPLDPEPGGGELGTVDEDAGEPPRRDTRHAEIQTMLVKLGLDMGVDVWVAANDRSVRFNDMTLGDVSVQALPPGLPEEVRRRIGLIDVVWLRRNAYIAAFEIEATTSILSGLARMGDLLAMIPNLDIPLFIVAPEARRARVFDEIKRPLFTHGLERPLDRRCRYISFEVLTADLESLGHRVAALDPMRYLSELAEEVP
jgi:hypothetical protein